MPITVLLVEDDIDLAETVTQFLELEGINVHHAFNGEAGINLAQTGQYDVLLLDVMLPRMDGLSVCSCLRRNGFEPPILMLTARDSLDDKLAGFQAGTDDYLVKPFELAELVARIRVLAKRRSGEMRKLQLGELRMDLDSKQAWRGEVQLKLTPSCWDLLECLLRHANTVVNRATLETVLWGDNPPESNTLKVHIHKLRQQVDRPASFPMIQTVPGQGFILRDEETT